MCGGGSEVGMLRCGGKGEGGEATLGGDCIKILDVHRISYKPTLLYKPMLIYKLMLLDWFRTRRFFLGFQFWEPAKKINENLKWKYL